MPARTIKRSIAVVAAAAAVSFGSAAAAAAAVSLGSTTSIAASGASNAAPASSYAIGSDGGAGKVSMQDAGFGRLAPSWSDDPHGTFDGTRSAVLCATAIEYGLIV
ncbi:MAG: hypothetical protein LBV34_21275 [Nocardiopsaceae bacterium]|jgi:hypothetical protein|nr:hypothetical protein [Nocardiopsaceae bacterium]